MSDKIFIRGADVSFVPMIEDCGGKYFDQGIQKDCLQVFKDNGFNYIRLRVWNKPKDGYCGTERTLEMARRIKKLGLKLLINFHYSDTWADPEKQTKPEEWRDLSFDELKNAVYEYTKDFIKALDAQNTLPDMVQIGNEITHGMLWDDGKVTGELNTDEQWTKFAALINAGINGVKDAAGGKRDVKIMIHIDRGGDNATSRYFYDRLISKNVDFDILGLSYYPYWHGTLTNLKNNLDDLAERYNKDVIVVECAYPFTLEYSDGSGRLRDRKWVHEGYEPTPDGQYRYLRDLINIVKSVPGNRGKGVFYWAPEWMSNRNWEVKKGGMNHWEYLAMFDFDGNALKAFEAFKEIE